jgi:hypothetical protein
LAAGIIDEPIFVTVVIMAIATSLMAGPVIKWLMAKPMPQPAPVALPMEESRS